MFRHRNHLRRWAARVLVLWLMGLVVGMANACLVPNLADPGARHVTEAATKTVHHHGHALGEGAPRSTSHHVPHDGVPPHHGSLTSANCKDFCGKVAISIAPIKSALDDVQGYAPPPSVAAIALPPPVLLPVRKWVQRRDGASAPPVSIAFLRLAL